MLSRIGFVAAAISFAVPAQAQIYTWTDANGHMVVSNKRPAPPPPWRPTACRKRPGSGPTAPAPGIRATRPVAASRATAYDDLISQHSRSNGVRPDLVRAVMQVESGFNPFAR